MLKIYVSSTYEDLKEYRKAVYHALRRMRHDVIAMEDYVAQDQRPVQYCLKDVASCDIYIGIIGWRYGFIPEDKNENPNRLSITELEYRKAKEKEIPCLIFLLDDRIKWPLRYIDGTRQSGTSGDNINILRNYLTNKHVVSFFKNPDHLAGLAVTAVEKEKPPSIPEHPPKKIPEPPPKPPINSRRLKVIIIGTSILIVIITGIMYMESSNNQDGVYNIPTNIYFNSITFFKR